MAPYMLTIAAAFWCRFSDAALRNAMLMICLLILIHTISNNDIIINGYDHTHMLMAMPMPPRLADTYKAGMPEQPCYADASATLFDAIFRWLYAVTMPFTLIFSFAASHFRRFRWLPMLLLFGCWYAYDIDDAFFRFDFHISPPYDDFIFSRRFLWLFSDSRADADTLSAMLMLLLIFSRFRCFFALFFRFAALILIIILLILPWYASAMLLMMIIFDDAIPFSVISRYDYFDFRHIRRWLRWFSPFSLPTCHAMMRYRCLLHAIHYAINTPCHALAFAADIYAEMRHYYA